MIINWVEIGDQWYGMPAEEMLSPVYCYVIHRGTTNTRNDKKELPEVLVAVFEEGRAQEVMRIYGNRSDAVKALKRRAEDHVHGQ